ncbi:hypothetical protein FOCC_FOCC001256 [Frankliniella occidentalis]|uniref:Peroxisomal leader peptide-processing protease n=1 Tax=Frankliniella occidentalis TaxID=133901 RepID=A0A9C6X614_FRAOC|nr:peroxisomal leader peptide-processing protease-like [Frankliniella occidentalis]XP_052129804.1 peroxisomal leader peptide-processing protease-like [Frankliniella occidentalis]KAE8752094.1 hypothetical protein FOCC_FOCC001256 [Frankliniella occidentalis]
MPSLADSKRSKLDAVGRHALLVRCGGRSCSGVLLDGDPDGLDWRPDGALVLVPGMLLHGLGVLDSNKSAGGGKIVIRRRAIPALSVVLRRGSIKPRAVSPPLSAGEPSVGAGLSTPPPLEDDLAEVQARVLVAWRWPKLAAALPQVLAELRLSSDTVGLESSAAEQWPSLQPTIRDASTCDDSSREVRALLSMFLLLQLQPVPEQRAGLGPVTDTLRRLLPRVPGVPPRGAAVCTASAPLGAPGLLGAVCQGVVSGAAAGGVLTLTDARVTPGCEGAGVYNLAAAAAALPCAVVLSPLTWWRGEAVGFTLCLGLRRLLFDAVLQLELRARAAGRRPRPALPPTAPAFDGDATDDVDLYGIDNSVVLVRCAHMWGSGVVVGKMGNPGRPVILTCAHVLVEDRGVTVCWGEHSLPAVVVWRSADGEPFDVAVLEIVADNPLVHELRPLTLDCRPPRVGEPVIAAGFPLFSERSAADPGRVLRPLVSRGEVSGWWTSASSQILTTCNVQSGASGGPLLRPGPDKPTVVGVLVCNAQVGSGKDAVVYPHVNFALWADAIEGPVNSYLKSGDKEHLTQLQCKSKAVHRQWKLQPPSMCKL